MIINEIGSNIDPRLKKIDLSFSKLKKDIKNKDVIKELKQNIKELTNTKINFSIIKNELNAFVLPEYYAPTAESVTKMKDMKLEELNKFVKQITICYGDILINKLSNRELTAVLLHEIGHVIQHTSNLPKIFMMIIKLSGIIVRNAWFLLFGVFLPIQIILLIFVVTRSLTFFDHREEYNCDSFSLQYGYGDELAIVMKKFKDIETDEEKEQLYIIKLIKKILFIMYGRSHPGFDKRIDNLVTQIKNDYQNKYPKLKKELKVLMV